jgi:YggT family protein
VGIRLPVTHYYRQCRFSFATMLHQIISLLLQVVVGLVTAVCLLRLYLQHQRIAFSIRSGNPLGPFIFALTDWLVLPLRRIAPPVGRWDTASLLAAYLLQLLQAVILWFLAGAGGPAVWLLLAAAVGLAQLALSSASILVIVYAVLSWVQAGSPLASLVGRLVVPWLSPIRRVVPLVGGIDLSPLVLLVLLQVAGIVLGGVAASLLG